MAIYQRQEGTVTGEGEPIRVPVTAVTPELLEVLEVEPVLGRWFSAEEAAVGAPFVVVLSHDLWRERFGSSPDVLGRTVTLYGTPAEIVGVMPARFTFPDPDVSLWRPLQIDAASPRVGGFNYQGIARLAEGATLDGLREALDQAIASIPERYPGDAARVIVEEARLSAGPLLLREQTVGTAPGTLWVLLGTAGLVLALACANLANLFLVRWEGRQREVAVRRALGAGRGSITAHFLAESLAVTLAGGAAAVGLGWAGVRVLRAVAPPGIPRLHEVALDPLVAVGAVAAAALAGLLFGGIASLRGGGAPAGTLRDAGRSGMHGRVQMRARNLLMAVQVALAMILLVGSGLMVRSYRSVASVDTGFDPDGVLTFRVGLPYNRYGQDEQAVAFLDALRERLTALPGVTVAGGVTCPPLSGMCHGDPMGVEGEKVGRGRSHFAHRELSQGHPRLFRGHGHRHPSRPRTARRGSPDAHGCGGGQHGAGTSLSGG